MKSRVCIQWITDGEKTLDSGTQPFKLTTVERNVLNFNSIKTGIFGENSNPCLNLWSGWNPWILESNVSLNPQWAIKTECAMKSVFESMDGIKSLDSGAQPFKLTTLIQWTDHFKFQIFFNLNPQWAKKKAYLVKIQIRVWTYGRDQILGSWSPMRRKVHSEQLKRSVRWNQCLNSWPGSNPWILEPNRSSWQRWFNERTILNFKFFLI